MLQKCCNQNETHWKYWTQRTFRHLKNAKIQTKIHKMDVLEAVENETLESHSSISWESWQVLFFPVERFLIQPI
jgi:hypothetical protein